MRLKNLNKYICFFTLFILLLPASAEDEIDIWNQTTENSSLIKPKNNDIQSTINSGITNASKVEKDIDIKIENANLDNTTNKNVFGIYDPAKNNFDLNMWSQTEGDKVRSSFNRINKIQLSNTATKLFENTILSFSYSPKGMDDKEFVGLKIDWMIENKRIDLIEKFLKQNNIFPNKKKAIQYLVDEV